MRCAHVGKGLSTIGYRIKEILNLVHLDCNVSVFWAPRSCNKAASGLCKWALVKNCNKDFDMDYSVEIHDIILNDEIN
ncbi:hypothetical protein J1N35_008110 [Gossypium stocksii]|uniref:RNase H type-1 domain-containing protein n=1 Tax=Gossypium stocksii TaxID=47602 RepID=A0A9D4AE25_9ROSI|nr:hypothetical protein J1N35_008110 [Gossypium stocksii]